MQMLFTCYSVDRLIGILSQTLQQGNALLSLFFSLWVMNEWPLLSLASFLFVVERLKGLLKGQGEVQCKSSPPILSRILLEHTGRKNPINHGRTIDRKLSILN